MKKTNLLFMLLSLLAYTGVYSQSERDPQIEAILADLTLEEKAGQLNLIPIFAEPTEDHLRLIREGKVGSIIKVNGVDMISSLQKVAVQESRAGIPILFQEDVIHGYKTIAPIPIGEAASWDLEAIQKSAAVAAREAAASGVALTYAPMVDVARDPRWGRVLETSGEDPYLGSLIGAARVKGFQASNPEGENILSCVKHFVGYGAALAGRDYNILDFSERELRETHLPPFQAAVDAGVASLMCAYSAYDGMPLCGNEFLMQDVLRGELGFTGLAMTDWMTISNLVKTGVAATDEIAVEMTMNAGLDMDMSAEKYVDILPKLVKKGKISEEQVNEAVRKVLFLKKQAGLLDQPMDLYNKERESAEILSERNIEETKEITLKSMVLLKNENQTLPLSADVQKIAVIGPLAEANRELLGWWHCLGDEKDVVNYHEGIKAEFSQAEISFAEGCTIDKFAMAGEERIPAAVATAAAADVVIVVLGEQHWMSGEGGGTASLHLPGAQEKLLAALAETGKTIVTVINAGRPYVLTEVAAHSDALIYAWMPGTTGGTALAEILAGKFNPQAKLPITFPYHAGQVPIYYSYRRTSHAFEPGITENRYSTTYRDVQNEPLYPFGYGLSYTNYAYSEISLDATEMTSEGSIKASIDVTNTGKMAGTEIVQLYLRDEVAALTRPSLELKDFSLVTLAPGETKTVTFEITPDKLTFIGPGKAYERILEPGDFTLMIGRNSSDLQETKFVLK